MLGSGIFINSTILAKKVGILSFICYPLVGLLMLPLILSITRLLQLHPSGGFYTFAAKEISPLAGFISGWSYATGKLASVVMIIQFACLLLQQTIPALQAISSITLGGILMIVFMFLNMLDIKTNSTIQTVFFGFKLVPILFGILTGVYLFSNNGQYSEAVNFTNIPLALPLVLFALAGFEAACSLSSRIENAERNAPLAVLISYGTVVTVLTLFQYMIYVALGSSLAALPDYRLLFPSLIAAALPSSPALGIHLINLIHLAITASALGGSYGIIFSNSWNFYTLAQHNHLIGSSAIKQLNRYDIPWLCVVIETVIYFLFLAVSQGNQIALQQIAAFGPTIAYMMSALSLAAAYRNRRSGPIVLPLVAVGNCLLLFGASAYSLMTYGMSSLLLFGLLFTLGMIMFWYTQSSEPSRS